MSVLAILQARAASRRLPNKVLLEVAGRPMLQRQIERIQRARSVDELVVATTDDPSDDGIEALCGSIGVASVRGPVDDVLERFVLALGRSSAEWVVRLTGDCPLTDPNVIDQVVMTARSSSADYVSNALHPTFPDGLDVEVVRSSCLRDAHRLATLPSEREHVTPYIYKHPERYRLAEVRSPVDHSALRWTVDEAGDLEFVRAVYAELHEQNPAFAMAEILELLRERPALAQLNSKFARNEGYTYSLQKDRA